MMTRDDREPIIVADAGPLIRLAAAGLLDTMRGLNRRIVLVDRIEEEVIGDRSKPFANEVAAWIERSGDSILRVRTVVGAGIESLRTKKRTPEEERLLKTALRDSGELALREFVGHWRPTESASALVIYEDARVAVLFLDSDFSVTLMTTLAFAETVAEWGVNADAVAALQAISPQFNLKPAVVGTYDADTPPDMRMLPQPKAKQ
jgi:hypothetical protein